MSAKAGECKYSDKSEYKGDWTSSGQRNGRGKMNYAGGSSYSGEFKEGMQHGLGIMDIKDNGLTHKYEGEFEDGYFHGYGIFIRSDGMRYEGQFDKGNITGCGLVTFADSTNGLPRQEGRFNCGSLVEPKACESEVQTARDKAAKARAAS